MGNSTLQLPTSVEELHAIANDEDQTKAWVAARRMGELVKAGITLKAEAMQADQQEAARAAGLKRLDLRNGATDGRPSVATGRHPLWMSNEYVDDVEKALQSWRPAQIMNAALDTGDVGQPAFWGANEADAPRMLHIAGGTPEKSVDAVEGEYSKFTLPSATAGVGENVDLAEFSNSTAGTVTLKRFGRFTDLSRESLIGTDAAGILSVHAVGAARDLDKVLIDLAETDASTPVVAGGGTAQDDIRILMATVSDATGSDEGSLTLVCHPDDAFNLREVTPIGGATTGEGFTRFSGARVYVTSLKTTGDILVANLRLGTKYFRARGIMTESDLDVKSDTLTLATSVVGGYGTGLIVGYAKAQAV